MKKATIQDLKLELWLRQRNSGLIYWETKNNKKIPIKDMDNNHLVNTLKMLLRNAEREFDALPEAEQDRIRIAFYDKLKQRADNKLEAILKENTLIADELSYQPFDD